MTRKVLDILGLGTLGYFAYRSYKKSDGTALGTLQQMAKDLQTGAESAWNSSRRIYVAVNKRYSRHSRPPVKHTKASHATRRGKRRGTKRTNHSGHSHAGAST